jgi:hypothetical protein
VLADHAAPGVGRVLRDGRAAAQAGTRIEPPPSLAWAAGTIPAATATAAPPEEPPAERDRCQGFRVAPKRADSVVVVMPSSGVAVLPKMTRPARR